MDTEPSITACEDAFLAYLWLNYCLCNQHLSSWIATISIFIDPMLKGRARVATLKSSHDANRGIARRCWTRDEVGGASRRFCCPTLAHPLLVNQSNLLAVDDTCFRARLAPTIITGRKQCGSDRRFRMTIANQLINKNEAIAIGDGLDNISRTASRFACSCFFFFFFFDFGKDNIEVVFFFVREKFPNNSLADLYESTSMPPELAKAHAKLDADVLSAYDLKSDATDAEILEVFFEMYAEQSKISK